jgi:hypothetical protein
VLTFLLERQWFRVIVHFANESLPPAAVKLKFANCVRITTRCSHSYKEVPLKEGKTRQNLDCRQMDLRTYSKSFDKCEPTFTLSAFTSLTFLQSIRAAFHEELVHERRCL